MKRSALVLASLLAVAPLAVCAANPTPEPGGANQVKAVEGKVGTPVFNGELRIKVTEVATVMPSGNLLAGPDEKYIVVRGVASNGTNKPYSGLMFDTALSDADGVIVQSSKTWGVRSDVDWTPGSKGIFDIPPGAAFKFQVPFRVSKDFTPAKLIITTTNPKYKAFRISIAPTDVKT